jgi:hypothetical protein
MSDINTNVGVFEDMETKIGAAHVCFDHPLPQDGKYKIGYILPRFCLTQSDERSPTFFTTEKPMTGEKMRSCKL